MSVAVSISPLRGIVCMVLALLVFTLSDAVSKWLTQGYPVGEIIFLRSFFMILPVLVMVRYRREKLSLRTENWRWHMLRTMLVVVSSFLIINSVRLLPLADAIAFLHAAPLMITALAFPLLGERVGWHRWGAVLAGFAGVLIMSRPTADSFQIAVMVPIAAAAATAVRDIVTRRMSTSESTNVMLIWSTVGLTLASALTLPFGWRTPTPFDFGLMVVTGLLVGTAHYLMVESLRLAEAALVAPFKYSSIVWGVLLGYMIWGDLPDYWIVTGSSLIIGSGLYILHREYRQR